MVRIYNSAVTSHLYNTIKTQSEDQLVTSTSNIVAPTLDLNPKYTTILKRSAVITSQGTTIVFTAGSNFYVTYVSLSMIKDVACDTGTVSAFVSMTDLDWDIITLSGITLTAQQQTQSVSFPFPLKLDKDGRVGVYVATKTAGTLIIYLIVGGFYL